MLQTACLNVANLTLHFSLQSTGNVGRPIQLGVADTEYDAHGVRGTDCSCDTSDGEVRVSRALADYSRS